ncbi:hypothetical protein MTO96_027860 [Rhipicephalus appendiculatus]
MPPTGVLSSARMLSVLSWAEIEDLMLSHKERRLLRHEFTLDELEDDMRRSREAELVRYRSQCGLLDIDGMDSATFRLMFRFHKHDLNDLCSALLVPPEITSAQNVRLCGREALCVLLRRLAYPNRWCHLEGIFGRHSSVMSSATLRLMDHILGIFGHLLTDLNNHEWISPASLKEFAGVSQR